ncbi:Holliday junction resolvase RuvX [Candidatus Peregrinibacteria bacterium]|jgi:putative holliday junction resolvase|nr:Holliday junction resolvase RuvX [Candidatus Peregrinibacteria bacterium]MBT4056407.1 Holliday junction resolvase RuvX [Candidatus Peregrinibacteria bacterium]
MKVLAVDYGLKNVGLASGDSQNQIAFPKGVVVWRSEEQVVSELLGICEEDGYGLVVFGLPLDMDGGKGKQYQLTFDFVEKFKEVAVDIEVEVVDERLSTFEAKEVLSEMKGVRKREGDKDVMAAKVILERWFDKT